MVRKLHATQRYMTQFDMKKYSPRIKPEEFRSWNEKMISKYDPDAFHHHSNSIIRFIESKRVKAILELMDEKYKEGRVIEVGCGAGNILEKVKQTNMFGIDISTSILSKAKKKLGNKADLVQGDAQNLPFKDQAFQQIICSEVLEHLLDPLLSLQEIKRILEHKGVAIISIPNESLINRVKSILIHLGVFQLVFRGNDSYSKMPERMEEEWHLQTFDLEEWLESFGKLFRVTRLKKIPFFWLPLRYVACLEK